jgi:methyl coenzyme M reductase subunit C-like uncharacterized protein (methanogenesis marker protein 7)
MSSSQYFTDDGISLHNANRNKLRSFKKDYPIITKTKTKRAFYDEHNLAANALGDFQDHMKKRKARAESIMINAAETLVKMKNLNL